MNHQTRYDLYSQFSKRLLRFSPTWIARDSFFYSSFSPLFSIAFLFSFNTLRSMCLWCPKEGPACHLILNAFSICSLFVCYSRLFHIFMWCWLLLLRLPSEAKSKKRDLYVAQWWWRIKYFFTSYNKQNIG